VAALVICYVSCKWLLSTPYGRAVVAVRENEVRAELLGHDARFIKLSVFVIGAAIAGLAGMLFASTVFVSPTVFGLATAAQVLIWVVVGGLGTLMGPVIACVLLQALAALLGKLGFIDPSVMLGLVLIGAVLLVPRGLLPPTLDALARARQWRPARPAPEAGEVTP
jgi:branched-chain amino acid transport system permease protein